MSEKKIERHRDRSRLLKKKKRGTNMPAEQLKITRVNNKSRQEERHNNMFAEEMEKARVNNR